MNLRYGKLSDVFQAIASLRGHSLFTRATNAAMALRWQAKTGDAARRPSGEQGYEGAAESDNLRARWHCIRRREGDLSPFIWASRWLAKPTSAADSRHSRRYTSKHRHQHKAMTTTMGSHSSRTMQKRRWTQSAGLASHKDRLSPSSFRGPPFAR